MATLSDSGPSGLVGILAVASAASSTFFGRPSRSPPRQTVSWSSRPSVVSASPRAVAARPSSASVRPGSCSKDARAGGRAKIDPMLARTAFGE
jgi:hypothetical protein